ncbi:hypothetical protein [Maribacter sp.]|uniref:hypothetical protein n=1 Tax=Maribacter sp. TaxID=1897614 RepID=UPI0025C30E18|nr:hypothetical protein [Maribacter sp.]
MKKNLFFTFIIIGVSCSNSKKEKSTFPSSKVTISKEINSQPEKLQSKIANSNFEIAFNRSKASTYTIVDSEYGNSSTIVQNSYDYTTKQLEIMPNMKRLENALMRK